MRVFIDANVLVTVLNKEYPRFDIAARLLSFADQSRFEFHTSTLAISICFYMVAKKSNTRVAYDKLKILSEKISIAVNKRSDLNLIFSNKRILDIEDGLQYFAAINSKNKVIVTYDSGDYHFSEIEVLSPEDFLMKYAL